MHRARPALEGDASASTTEKRVRATHDKGEALPVAACQGHIHMRTHTRDIVYMFWRRVSFPQDIHA